MIDVTNRVNGQDSAYLFCERDYSATLKYVVPKSLPERSRRERSRRERSRRERSRRKLRRREHSLRER